MHPSLTKEQKQRVRRALEYTSSHRKLQTSIELHQFVLHWNWDDGYDALRWVIRQPQCDLGTALIVYWGTSPYWYYQKYQNREELLKSNGNIEAYDLIKEIEEKVLRGFYQEQKIRVDACGDRGYYYDQSLVSPPLKQSVPGEMFQVTPGEQYAKEDLWSVRIQELTDKEKEKVSYHIKRGLKILQQYGNVDKQTSPDVVVATIHSAIDTYRQKMDGLFDKKKQRAVRIRLVVG